MLRKGSLKSVGIILNCGGNQYAVLRQYVVVSPPGALLYGFPLWTTACVFEHTRNMTPTVNLLAGSNSRYVLSVENE